MDAEAKEERLSLSRKETIFINTFRGRESKEGW
jgi:hypothetical protein